MKQGVDTISVFSQIEPSEELVSRDKSWRALTVQDLSTEAGNFILAGTDTTAYTLTCLVWSVLRHPSIYSALHEEVSDLENNFTDSALEALPLLNAVINETLRLYGPASGSLPRIVPPGGVQLGGYFIPENTTVSTQAWTLHRNEDIWPNAET
jgi:cytochrome P450